MTQQQSELDLIRSASRRIADKFDLEYWREKDKKKEYPWEFVKAFADGRLARRTDAGGVRRPGAWSDTRPGSCSARDCRIGGWRVRRICVPLLRLPARPGDAARLGGDEAEVSAQTRQRANLLMAFGVTRARRRRRHLAASRPAPDGRRRGG